MSVAPDRRALFVTYHFPPSLSPGSLRMTSLARHLRREGWEITVVTARRAAEVQEDPESIASIPEGVRVEGTDSVELYRRIHSNVSRESMAAAPLSKKRRRRYSWVRRALKAPFMLFYQLTRFPDKQVGWQWPMFFRAWRVLRRDRPRVVLSSSPPHSSQLPLVVLKWLFRFRWVADFRDPWTAPSRHRKTAFSLFIQRRMETMVLRAADVVIANTKGNAEALLDTFAFLRDGRVAVVTNGYDGEPFRSTDAPPPGDSADIVYVGEVYAEMLDLYSGAMCIMKERGARLPVLHLYGLYDERERRRVEGLGLGGAIVHKGVVSWSTSIDVMKGAHALLLLLPHHERWGTCVPSKLYPYLFSGRPVLAIVPEGDAAAIVRETGTGDAITTRNPDAVAAGIESFLARIDSEDWTASRVESKIGPYAMSSIAQRIHELMLGVADG